MLKRAFSVLTIALALTWAGTANALERWINIHNDDGVGEYIVEVNFSHRDNPYWGRNLIDEAIPPGFYQTVYPPGNMDGYCKGDIRVIFSNGFEEVATDVNFCEETGYTFWSD